MVPTMQVNAVGVSCSMLLAHSRTWGDDDPNHCLVAADRPSTRLGEPSPVPGHVEGGGGWSASAELRAVFLFISSFPFLLRLMQGA